MPAPTNLSAATATAVGALPATLAQTVDDAGVTYTVWFSVVAPAGALVLGAWAFGDLVTYRPTLRAYTGPVGAPVQVLAIAALNRPMQFPVTAGETYYLSVTPNAGNPTPAALALSVLAAPTGALTAGDVLPIADAAGHRTAVYAPDASFTVRRFVDLPWDSWANAAANLSDGTMLLTDEANARFVVYDGDCNFLLALPLVFATNAVKIAANRTVNKFYVLTAHNDALISVVSAAGVVEPTTHTIPSATMDGLCVNNDETILFWTSATFGAAVKQWDLVAGAALPNLAAGVTGFRIYDMLALPDGTLLVAYWSLGSVVARDFFVRRYSSVGVIVQTYTFAGDYLNAAPRMVYGADHPNEFVVWAHQLTDPVDGTHVISVFLTVRVSDGVVLETAYGAEFDELAGANDDGVYAYSETATPLGRFGNANSCPFLVAAVGGVPEEPEPEVEEVCIPARPSVACLAAAAPSVDCAAAARPRAGCWAAHDVDVFRVGAIT